jgi:hypothetical protein
MEGLSMQTTRKLLVPVLMLLMAIATPAFANDGAQPPDRAALAAAVEQHVARQAADRAAIHEAFVRPQVKDVATRMGVDLGRLDAAVGTLSGADLARAATAARDVNQALVGGASTVVISTTTIIILLLVVILLVVALQ